MSRAQRSLHKCQSSMSRAQRSLGKYQSSMSRGQRSLHKCQSSISRAQRSLGKCQSSMSRAQRSLGKCQSSISRAQRSLHKCQSSMSRAYQNVGKRSTLVSLVRKHTKLAVTFILSRASELSFVSYSLALHQPLCWKRKKKGGAYKKRVKKSGAERSLPGLNLNYNQLFFLQRTQFKCADMKNVNHPAEKFRVNAPLQNLPDFAKAYNCPVGSPMNPEKQCNIL
ncbi:endothelin-converting enzyme 2 protein [Plakobranchus ocellatus]|uniref:Endothelin-converting enzyme 2 protein n=1 Tax=Plakobranchus ocellatus TaxID=259542 RepID=A0AAV4CY89_9GAST|nr:endothelin-converting enzyme 2 protein [Plakobranchus ocellatus]